MTTAADWSALGRVAALAVTQPLPVPVPADDIAFAERKGTAPLAWRTLRRWLGLALSGQAGLLHTRIDPAWRSCLWIHAEAPQVGDALMDLAPRSLLRANGIEVDFCAAPHLVALFEGDRHLRRCFPMGRAPAAARYDFAIVSSHARRALQPKRQLAPELPWISLAGYYAVPDYHRALFVTERLADALGVQLAPADRCAHARQKLDIRAPRVAPLAPGAGLLRVGLALGGVRADRTYEHWPAVVSALHAAGVSNFVLTGSANAVAARNALIDAAPIGLDLTDLVDRTDLHGAWAALGDCDLVVCADGGLMHLALTATRCVLALFSGAIDPRWRLPLDFDGAALRSTTPTVSGIPPAEVAATALRLLATSAGPTAFTR